MSETMNSMFLIAVDRNAKFDRFRRIMRTGCDVASMAFFHESNSIRFKSLWRNVML